MFNFVYFFIIIMKLHKFNYICSKKHLIQWNTLKESKELY